jgi:hypothetical protein
MVTISDLKNIGFSDAQANHILANMKLKKMTLVNAEIAEVKLMGYDTTQATAIVTNINENGCTLAEAIEQLILSANNDMTMQTK